jgi:hypothetical protein
MRRAQFYAIAAVSVLLLIFVVGRLHWKEPSGRGQLRPFGLVQTAMKDCTTASNDMYGGPPRSNISHVVRLTIPLKFDVGNGVSRKILENDPARDEDQEASLDKNNPTGSSVDELGTFPLDMDLTKDGKAAGKFTQIRLVLTDSARFDFYHDSTVQGVMVGDKIGELKPNKLGFCGAHYYSTSDKKHTYPTAVFYMPLDTQKGTAGYNFVLVPSTYPTVQISIDPQVRNGSS